ncbi:MAG: TetR/AcrR family transcriptional regulator [Bacteroidota bacterium]
MGVSERKLREKSARKNAIIEAAEEVFFSKGIEKASMDEVARVAELSKGTLYLYFKNKNALYRAILRRAYTALWEELRKIDQNRGNGLQAVILIAEAYVEYSTTFPGYFEAILHYENDVIDIDNPEQESVKSIVAGNQVLELIVEQIKRGISDKSIKPDVDPVKTALVLWGQTTGMLQLLKSKNELLNHYYHLTEGALLEHLMSMIKASLENNNKH